MNFQGAKKFLDVNLEETSLQNPEFVLCLDSIAEDLEGNWNVHVSKTPNKIGPIARFVDILTKKVAEHEDKSFVEVVQKKINLADTFKWPHQRFSMRRMPAFTLSTVKSHSSPLRTTIFNQHFAVENQVSPTMENNIQAKTKILAEALATYIFQRNDDEEISEVFSTIASLRPYMHPQSMLKANNIKHTFEKYLKNVKVIIEKPDAREPDFMFYDGEEATLNVYK